MALSNGSLNAINPTMVFLSAKAAKKTKKVKRRI
jgi:hypothetical protein